MLEKIIFLFVAFVFVCKEAFADPVTAIGSLVAYMATPAGILTTAGIGLSAASLMDQPKSPQVNQANTPAAPDPNAAAESANDKMTQARRTLLLSGGDTTLTGSGGAPLLGANLHKQQLLGG